MRGETSGRGGWGERNEWLTKREMRPQGQKKSSDRQSDGHTDRLKDG